jgi:hypothetical protein
MTDKRRRGLWGALTADPWRKLLAITLAVMSWFFVDSRINRKISVPLALQFVGSRAATGVPVNRIAVVLPTDRVVGLRFLDGDRVIDTAEVVLSGPRYRVDEVERGPLDLQITTLNRVDWNTRTSEVFTAEDVRAGAQALLKDLQIELVPQRIRVEVERLESQEVQLSTQLVEIDERAFEGRLVQDSAEFTPPTATLRGPAIALEEFNKRSGKLFRTTMTAAGDRQVRGQLDPIQPGQVALASPVMLTMTLRPRTELFDNLDVPILVDDRALPPEVRGVYQPDAPSKKVRIRAGGDLRLELARARDDSPDALREFVNANLRLHVLLLPGQSLGNVIEPRAMLLLVSKLAANVARDECLLDEVVVVILKRAP